MKENNLTTSRFAHTIDEQESNAIKYLANDANQIDLKVSDWGKVNLRNVGHKLAGLTAANTDSLKIALNRIREAVILQATQKEENSKELLEQKISAIDSEILSLRSKKNEVQTKVESYEEGKIPKAQSEVTLLKDQLVDLEVEVALEKDIENTSFLSKVTYSILAILGLVWIYIFYVSASFSAFFKTIKDNEQIQVSELFTGAFTAEAFEVLNFHWLLPFMFLLIGAIFHISLESIDKLRGFKIFGAVMLILFADGVLAYSIEAKEHSLKFMTGQVDSSSFNLMDAFMSPSFYMVLIMGSVSVISWSILLNKICSFFSTNKMTRGLLIKQRSLKKKINAAMKKVNEKIFECEELKTEITNLENEISIIESQKSIVLEKGVPVPYSKTKLKNNLLAFYNGWMTNVSTYNYRNLEENTRQAFVDVINGMELFIAGINSDIENLNISKAS